MIFGSQFITELYKINSIKPESKPMKKYRCKIDCPGFKKDQIITDSGFSYMGFQIIDYPDCFEPLPDRWLPEEGEEYYTIMSSDFMLQVTSTNWWNFEPDQRLLEQNRVFRTKEKAKEVLKKILQVLEENKEV